MFQWILYCRFFTVWAAREAHIYMPVLCSVTQLCLALCDPMDCRPPGSSVHGDSPGKNTGVGFHALLQGILPTQGSNSRLPHCRRILYQLSKEVKCILNGKFKSLKIILKSLWFFPQKLLKCITWILFNPKPHFTLSLNHSPYPFLVANHAYNAH